MQTPVNHFKAALREATPQVGLWIGITDTVCLEIAAGAGFDWLLLDAEHSPHDLRTVLACLQTLAAYPVSPVVRLPVGDPTIMKKVLDIGAQTVLVPMVESAGQARDLVAAMRYPPGGIRGVGTALARAARWNRAADYFERADGEMCLIVQIETARGLDRLEEIAAVEGVDALFIGPADLAASLGHLGKPGHPDVQAAIRSAIERTRRAGKGCGSISADPDTARHYVTLGCNLIALGTDTALLASATKAAISRFRQATAPPGGKPGSDAVY